MGRRVVDEERIRQFSPVAMFTGSYAHVVGGLHGKGEVFTNASIAAGANEL